MGGAQPVGRGDADWMVELYSTLPYTAAEIEADSKLPPAEQKHLAQRSPAELAHACGGTMIGRDLVLTAAHCVATGRFLPPNESRVFTDRRVRVGSLLLGRGGETRAVVGMVIHQGYTGEGSGLPDDIALLLLKTDEPIRLGIRSLKVSTAVPKPGTDVVGLGWGYTQAVAPGANVLMSMSDQLQHNPDNLQVAPLELLGQAECNNRVQGKFRSGMLCLVTPKSVLAKGGPPTFSCRGDSGGPLVRYYATDKEELVGLTSWSLGCGYKDTPSVYTDAAYFSRWVDAARKAIRPGAVIRVGDPAQSH
jgi:secreted trypsin-like serine protease